MDDEGWTLETLVDRISAADDSECLDSIPSWERVVDLLDEIDQHILRGQTLGEEDIFSFVNGLVDFAETNASAGMNWREWLHALIVAFRRSLYPYRHDEVAHQGSPDRQWHAVWLRYTWIVRTLMVVFNFRESSTTLTLTLQRQEVQEVGDTTGKHRKSVYEIEDPLSTDVKDLDSFQRLILTLRKRLEAVRFRRADGKFFGRVVTTTNLSTQAFKMVLSVDDWVISQTSYAEDYGVWKIATKPVTNVRNAIEYFTNRLIPEAPELKENHHLRSFEGDALGRGSGIYCSNSDFFFDYRMKNVWADLAQSVTTMRRAATTATNGAVPYTCTVPSLHDVCIVHLDGAFYYDIFAEVKSHNRFKQQGLVVFREGYEWECTEEENRINNNAIGRVLDANIGPIVECLDDVIGLHWDICDKENIQGAIDRKEVQEFSLEDIDKETFLATCRELISDGRFDFSLSTALSTPIGKCEFVVIDGSSSVAIPRVTPGLQPRHALSIQEEGEWLFYEGRYFITVSGRTWLDCDCREIDHIYRCQQFTEFDRFYLYALKGRLLFRVGERDFHQITLFLEGVGGCGKSTIMNAQMRFLPPHKRGVLSANIEPLFGMSQAMREGTSEVIFCNEAASDLKLKQEEWQVSTSGEWASFAVKNSKPCVMQCRAQHFWVGNSRPGFKNDQQQMSRRLAAVLMPFPVTPRNGEMQNIISAKQFTLLRREVLAYESFLKRTGSIDPMSVPQTLPPAFKTYYNQCIRETDPVLDMIEDGLFVQRVIDGKMLWTDFRECFSRYKSRYDITKPKTLAFLNCQASFNHFGIRKTMADEVVIDGTTFRRVDVLTGLLLVPYDE